MIFTSLLNYTSNNTKIVNHFMAWLTSIIIFFLSPYSLLKSTMIKQAYNVLYIAFYITILFGILEFVDVNILHLNIVNKVPRPDGNNYDPLFIGGIRVRSFFAESGYFGMFVALYLPLILYFERGKLTKKKNIILLVLTGTAMLCTFSTTFFILLLFFLLFTFIFYKRENLLIRMFIVFFFFIVIYIFFKNAIDTILYVGILSKFSSTSIVSRNIMNAESLNLMFNDSSILHMLFGYGPGSYDYLGIDAAISTYINIFRDLGVIGLSLFILFYLSIMIKALRNKDLLSKYLLISLTSSMVYFQTNTSYYYAFIWFIPILIMKSKDIHNE
jgi:hypothetical protein